MRNSFLSPLLLVSTTLMAGCGATMTTIRTEPPGAIVFAGKVDAGKSPVTFDLNTVFRYAQSGGTLEEAKNLALAGRINDLGIEQALGLETKDLLLRAVLDGYEDGVKAVRKRSDSLFGLPRWPDEVVIRLKKVGE